MRIPHHLSLSRHNIYYFRFPVPKELHPAGKASHVRISLRTTNEREATYTAYRLSYYAAKITSMLYNKQMTFQEITSTIKSRLKRLIDEEKSLRLEQGRYDENKVSYYTHVTEHYPSYYKDNEFKDGDMVFEGAIRNADKLFPDLDIPQDDVLSFIKEFVRQYPEALKVILKFNENPDDLDFVSKPIEANDGSMEMSFVEAIDKGAVLDNRDRLSLWTCERAVYASTNKSD